MGSATETESYVDQAVEAFRTRLVGLVNARGRVPTAAADRVGEVAARFAAAHLGAHSPVVERIGAVYTTEELSRWLATALEKPLTTEAVRKRAKQRQLVGFRTDDGHWVFPAWQFDAVAGRLLPNGEVAALWRQLPHGGFLDAADLAAWMNSRLRSLDATPHGRARTHGADDAALRAAVSRLHARLAGTAA